MMCNEVYIGLLRREVVPALGCTEPIAVALAVARAREALPGAVVRVSVGTSANIYKNGMGVGIPGTGQVGLLVAAALGAVEGRSVDGLELLQHVSDAVVARANALIAGGGVAVHVVPDAERLYVHAEVADGQGHVAGCTIARRHSRIVEVTLDGTVVYREDGLCGAEAEGEDGAQARAVSVAGIFDFVNRVPFGEIEFILESERLNRRIAQEGLSQRYGLQVGRRLWESRGGGVVADDLLTRAMAMTSAASDARMAGSTIPVMSNSGSGNQGIAVTVPVLVAADHLGSSRDALARALALAHLVAIHIKGYLGRLSALCGCVVASSGAGCGIAYLMGGGLAEVEATVKNMIGNITGMLCDGAKVGCALKVSAGVSCAVTSALLAMQGACISSNDGIIEESVERTISNLGQIGRDGMSSTDDMVLAIMLQKGCC